MALLSSNATKVSLISCVRLLFFVLIIITIIHFIKQVKIMIIRLKKYKYSNTTN